MFCSGFCQRGYYCPLNSTSPTQVPCPPGRYGFTERLKDEGCTDACPLGHYCPAATADPIPCPAGSFGNQTGLINSSCRDECTEGGCEPSQCQEGYYCPAGSVSEKQFMCGSAAVYCPTGSAQPTPVSPGYYSVGPFPTENDKTRTAQVICPPGSFCRNGVQSPCPIGTFGATPGLASSACSGLCPPGRFCPLGSWNATSFRCPAGRYGATAGLSSSACSGRCSPGYHCPEGSVSPQELECGVATSPSRSDLFFSLAPTASSGYVGDYGAVVEVPVATGGSAYLAKNATKLVLSNPNSVFCPASAAAPIKVFPGFYSVGGTRTTRSAQVPCPPGSYCVGGIIHDCPAGRYGISDRLTAPDCTGPCARGFYCPIGSTTRNQFPCPVGRYGSQEGLADASCSGACKRPTDCPLASTLSTPLASSVDSNVY